MKIILAIKSGLARSVNAWKGILIYWLVSLVMVSFLVIPLKASLKAALGKSMVTEKLAGGINFDVLGDFGSVLNSMASSLFAGIMLLVLVAVLVNIFIAGGIFGAIRNSTVKVTSVEFFSASAKNFWSYLVISVILYLIAIVMIICIVVLPVSIAANADSAPEGTTFKILVISGSLFVLAISILLLVADYSRAWQAVRTENACFKALGFGFSQTFRTFVPSFGLMLIIIILQGLVAMCVMKIIALYTPSSGSGVLFLFLISQLLFMLKIFLKVMRYGSVTSLMEQNPVKARMSPVISPTPLHSDPEILIDSTPVSKTETIV